jgi:hypothetical protein
MGAGYCGVSAPKDPSSVLSVSPRHSLLTPRCGFRCSMLCRLQRRYDGARPPAGKLFEPPRRVGEDELVAARSLPLRSDWRDFRTITPGLGTRWVLCPMGHAVWSMRPWARKFLSDRVEELRAVTVDLVPSGKAPEVEAIGDVEAAARVRPPPTYAQPIAQPGFG